MSVRVAIGAPVRSRAWILPAYLAALEAISHPDKQYVFLENDSTDDTLTLLGAWKPTNIRPLVGDFVKVTIAPKHVWHTGARAGRSIPGHRRNEYGQNQYAHLAGIRNQFIDLFLEQTDADYLLSVDSDVIVPPDILQVLLPLTDGNTIVGAAICNIAGRELDGHLAGNFLTEQAGLIQHPPSYPLSGTIEVAVTGACYLIPRAVVEAGVRYAPHIDGEDVPFCAAARAIGTRILVTFDTRPTHRMVEGE